MTEYNPYGARHFLRELDGEAASELRERTIPLQGGGVVEKGYSADTDELDPAGLFEFRTLVLRRSPVRSRPPSPYRLVWSGDTYEVWHRPEGMTTPPERIALGSALEPTAVPDCAEVQGLGLLVLSKTKSEARLLAARHPPLYDATDGSLTVPKAGTYEAWLEGSVRGSVDLYVDGSKVGGARHQINNEGGFIGLGETQLSAGEHEVELRFGGGGFPRPETGPLLFVPVEDEAGEVVSVPLAELDSLCGKPWGWIEAVASG